MLTLIFQPIMGAVASTVFVAAAVVVGLILRVPGVRRFWRWYIAAALGTVSLCLMCFGVALGITSTVINPETGTPLTILRPTVALPAYFVRIFAIANWPLPVNLSPITNVIDNLWSGVRSVIYSYRRASIGSIRDARRAGR